MCTTMADPDQERPAVATGGSVMVPCTRASKSDCLVGGPKPIGLDGYPFGVQQTMMAARATATRDQYENRWRLFTLWCAERGENPRTCALPCILMFLQSLLEAGRAPGTLHVYIAALSLYHEPVEGSTIGSHKHVTSFLRGATRLRPLRAQPTPKWDLQVVLGSLCPQRGLRLLQI